VDDFFSAGVEAGKFIEGVSEQVLGRLSVDIAGDVQKSVAGKWLVVMTKSVRHTAIYRKLITIM
jgi:hypothetical protein